MIRTMIVDDNPLICESLVKKIRWSELGCSDPVSVTDGDMAKGTIEDYRPYIVVSDIRMPGLNGLDLLAWAKQRNPGIQFIIITGFDDFNYASRALKEGAIDIILKPLANIEVTSSLKRTIQVIRRLKKEEDHTRNLERRIDSLLPDGRVKFFRDIILTHDDYMPYLDLDSLPMETAETFRLYAYVGDLSTNLQKVLFDNLAVKLQKLYSLNIDYFPVDRRYCAVVYGEEINRIDPRKGMGPEGTDSIVYSGIYNNWFDLKTAYREITIGAEIRTKDAIDTPLMFSPQVDLIISVLEKNHSRRIGLNDLASEMKLSGAHISRLLKKATGMTFVDLLARIRIKHSIELLRSGRYRINEAGMEVGLDNYAYFYQMFKKYTGYSPREYPHTENPFSVFRRH